MLFFPMGMMSDSGTTLAVTFSSIGLLGCFLLIIGGIVGAMTKRWISLVPGTVVILIALTPAMSPFAIVAILLVYVCYVTPRTNGHDELELSDVDAIANVQIPEEPYKDDKSVYNAVQLVVSRFALSTPVYFVLESACITYPNL